MRHPQLSNHCGVRSYAIRADSTSGPGADFVLRVMHPCHLLITVWVEGLRWVGGNPGNLCGHWATCGSRAGRILLGMGPYPGTWGWVHPVLKFGLRPSISRQIPASDQPHHRKGLRPCVVPPSLSSPSQRHTVSLQTHSQYRLSLECPTWTFVH